MKWFQRQVGALCVLAGLAALGMSAAGQESPQRSAATPHAEAELVADVAAIPASGGTFSVALRKEIIPGWHTYWSNPGDSGEPTQITWSLPEGFEAGAIEWPHPARLPFGPLVNFGYKGEVVYPIQMTAPAGLQPGSEVTLRANVYWLVCEDVCIPEEVDLALTLPVSPGSAGTDERGAALISEARANLPKPAPWSATFQVENGSFALALPAPELSEGIAAGRITDVVFFPDQAGVIKNAEPQSVRYGPDGVSLTVPSGFAFDTGGENYQALSGLVVLTERLDGQTYERALTFDIARGAVPSGMTANALTPSSGGFEIGVAQALLFALLGGLILNLMPCVFPVLFMKALAFVQHARSDAGLVRLNGIVFTLGILVSFAAVAGILIALRAGGAQIGWGFQLQDPLVNAVLIYVLFLVGLNLSGVFQIGGSVMGVGQGLAGREGLTGSFFTGVLATVVATPCTAPFMGAALGFALTQPILIGLAIFLALGLGMALPWLLLSFFPALLRLLPKPGAWMERFKQLLAFPVYGTVVWLVWVLAQQTGTFGIAVILSGIVLVAFAAWIWGALQESPSGGRTWKAVGLVAGLAALAGVVWTGWSLNAAAPVSASASGGGGAELAYEAWSPERVEALRAEGTPIFVNFTAAWCVTCLVNERTVFTRPAIKERFEAAGVVYLKADWTNRDPRITQALERFGRAGVPLYLAYVPGEEPQILPQVLREQDILAAFEEL